MNPPDEQTGGAAADETQPAGETGNTGTQGDPGQPSTPPPARTTADLEARQQQALDKNAGRKRLIGELQETNTRLEQRISELESGGADVAALRAELATSNRLLGELQDAVLTDEL